MLSLIGSKQNNAKQNRKVKGVSQSILLATAGEKQLPPRDAFLRSV